MEKVKGFIESVNDGKEVQIESRVFKAFMKKVTQDYTTEFDKDVVREELCQEIDRWTNTEHGNSQHALEDLSIITKDFIDIISFANEAIQFVKEEEPIKKARPYEAERKNEL